MKSLLRLKAHRGDSRTGELFRFFLTGASQALAALGGLLLAVVIARTAGSEQLGMFTVMISLLGMLGMIARRGQGSLLTRAVASALHSNGSGASVSLLILAIRRVLLLSILLGLAGSGILFSGLLGSPYPGSVEAFPVMLLLITVLAMFAAYARGSERPWLSPMFELGGISFLAVLLLAPILLFGTNLTSFGIISILLISMLVPALIAGVIARSDHPISLEMLSMNEEMNKELSRGQVPFMLIAMASFLVKSGSFLLAAPFLSDADLGLLRASERLALLVSFSVLAINPIIAPRIVRLSRGGDSMGLRRLTGRAVLASTGIAVCVLLPLLIWPERVLALMGAEFTAAVPYLRVMACAHFLMAAIGPLMVLLNMSGRERASMWISLASLALASFLFPFMCWAYGGIGFAIAFVVLNIIRLGLVVFSNIFGKSSTAPWEKNLPCVSKIITK